MNAKQMAEKARLTDRFGETVGYFFAEETVTLEAFCDQYAKEQREKCALNIDQEAIYCGEEAIINRIMNAPNPEI